MEMEGLRPRHVRDMRNHVDRLDVLFFVIIEEKEIPRRATEVDEED